MKDYTLLPADSYIVVNKTILTDYDKKILISLYKPLVGAIPISLYLTLWNDLDDLELFSKHFNHHHLMSMLKIDLKIIKESKETLESFGLLRTYYKKGDINQFVYELYSPLNPKDYFDHPLLNVLLYSSVGKYEYEKIKLKYSVPKINLKEYEEITSTLDEVYETVPQNLEDLQKRNVLDIKSNSNIDYDLLISSMPKGVINPRAFGPKTKELINNLSFIYNIDTLKMIEIIRSVLNEFGMIDKINLRIETRKYYEFKNNSLPTIVYRSQPEYLKSPKGDFSKRGQIISIFENTTPYDFLKNKNRGIDPSVRDLKILEMLLIEINLTPAVVNVLIDYVLKINDNKLIKNYIEPIATEWKRADLKTAKEAMEYASGQHEKISKSKKHKETTKTTEPIWFNEEIEKKEISKEEEQELEELLKEFK